MLLPSSQSDDWGFYSHRLINRMAVFTLPSEMILLYKVNIDFVTDHAVDPDKRRYATQHEAVRHYIDIDHWGVYPFEHVPRRWGEALAGYAEINCISPAGDTSVLHQADVYEPDPAFTAYFKRHILPQYYEDIWTANCDTIKLVLPGMDCSDCQQVLVSEGFSQYGILPYHLYSMQQQLTRAFEEKKLSRILQLSADFGHYIGDAHVPLHTTSNYNGQLSNQVGIHGFWETRIPELFAEEEYDFFVGKAEYIKDPVEYYWNIVLESHRLVYDVLDIEKALSKSFPEDQQYCFEERMERTIRTYCTDYARAYADAMKGMVERRMRESIQSIGSAWYTAWVDAGQPTFEDVRGTLTPAEQAAFERLEREFRLGGAKGRVHEN